MAANLPEPWLRGPIEGVHPIVMPVFFSFAQVREDLATHVAGLSQGAVWKQMGRASVGFHLKHLAGSVDRLTTYLAGNQLTSDQLDALSNESKPDAGLDQLLEAVNFEMQKSEKRLLKLDPRTIYEPRSVGRQALPTTVLGLLVHLAEHTQRHLGQAIILAAAGRETKLP